MSGGKGAYLLGYNGTSGIPVATSLPTAAIAPNTAARDAIERLTAATVQPLLSTEDIDALVELAKCPDVDGYIPSDSNWTATWDIARAVLEGWRMKLGKASAMHNFNDGGVSLHRQQVFDNINKIWAAIGSEACRFVPVKVREQVLGGAAYEPIGDLEMLVRKEAQITTANRVEGEGKTWAVLSVTPRHTHARIILGGIL